MRPTTAGSAAKWRPPPPVADHHRARRVGSVVGGRQHAAERRGDPERLEVLAAHQLHRRVGRVVAEAVGGEGLLVDGHRRERPGPIGGVLQVGVGGDAERRHVARSEHADQATSVGHGQRPQQQTVGDGDERAGAADAHGERGHGGEGQDWPRREHAGGMDHIAQEVRHGWRNQQALCHGRPKNRPISGVCASVQGGRFVRPVGHPRSPARTYYVFGRQPPYAGDCDPLAADQGTTRVTSFEAGPSWPQALRPRTRT